MTANITLMGTLAGILYIMGCIVFIFFGSMLSDLRMKQGHVPPPANFTVKQFKSVMRTVFILGLCLNLGALSILYY